MIDENPFFTFGEIKEEKKASPKVKSVQKATPVVLGKPVEKIMVHRSVDKNGDVCTCWADRDSIHVDALKNYEKYKEFY